MKIFPRAICLVSALGLFGAVSPSAGAEGVLSASITPQGMRLIVEVASSEGWICSGTMAAQSDQGSGRSRRSGGSGNSSQRASSQQVPLKCSDETTGSAQVGYDQARREYNVAFRHKEHGTQRLRVRDR